MNDGIPMHKLSIIIECSDDDFTDLHDRIYSMMEENFMEPEWEIDYQDDIDGDLEEYRDQLRMVGTGDSE